MEKIAQIVITKTLNGAWKITSMSLKQTETCNTYISIDRMIDHFRDLSWREWEQLSLDI